MTALPSHHHFRHAIPLLDQPGSSRDFTAHTDALWQDGAASWSLPDDAETLRHDEFAGVRLRSPGRNIALIVLLSLLCWALVIALWHMVASLLA